MNEVREEAILRNIRDLKKDMKNMSSLFRSFLLTEYSMKDVAAVLNRSESYVYKIPKSQLDFKKSGKFRVYLKEDVLSYKAFLLRD